MKYELNSKADKYSTSLGKGQYQNNQICNFCGKFNNGCNGELHKLDKFDPNKYCPEFVDRYYTREQESENYNIQSFVNYIKGKMKS